MQRPLTSQWHGSVSQREQLGFFATDQTPSNCGQTFVFVLQMSGGGLTYFLFMTVSSGSMLNSLVLTASYILSSRTRAMIRPSLFVSHFPEPWSGTDVMITIFCDF
jgi:hypothetical protein